MTYRNIGNRYMKRSAPCLLVMVALLAAAPAAHGEYRTIEIRETAQMDREGWPIVVGVPVPADAGAEALKLVRVDEAGDEHALRFQEIERLEPRYLGNREPRDPVNVIEIAFLADLPAGATVRYRLYYDGDEAASPAEFDATDDPTLNIQSADGLERTVDTGVARFAFHENSGQLLNYQFLETEFMPQFDQYEIRPVHHNPDVWSPPHAWGHVSGWDVETPELRPEYREIQGPIMWQSLRTGDIPRSNGVDTSVTYTIFAGMPVIFEASMMRFTRDTRVNAVRNNELVFSRGYHTHGIYTEHDGQITAVRGYDPDDPPKIHGDLGVEPLPPDIPFIGLFHETRGHGVGMVTLERFTHGTQSLTSAQSGGASYYFNDYGEHRELDKNFLYFCRGEIRSPTVVPAGAVFAERSAILAFPVGEKDEADRFDELQRWTKLLRHPPYVRVR